MLVIGDVWRGGGLSVTLTLGGFAAGGAALYRAYKNGRNDGGGS